MQNPVFKKLNFNKFLQKHYTYFFTTKIIKLNLDLLANSHYAMLMVSSSQTIRSKGAVFEILYFIQCT